MRIISQGGNADLPYEEIALCMACEDIIARHNDKEYLMARYSTMDKAKKAMEMLRNFRTITTVENIPLQEVMLKDPVYGIFNECFDWSYWSDDKAGILKVDVVKKCDYFQFPQDEDVEV